MNDQGNRQTSIDQKSDPLEILEYRYLSSTVELPEKFYYLSNELASAMDTRPKCLLPKCNSRNSRACFISLPSMFFFYIYFSPKLSFHERNVSKYQYNHSFDLIIYTIGAS